jgi:hypothetical protein
MPGDAQALALADGEGGQALVLAQQATVLKADRTWDEGLGYLLAQEARHPALADEADILALALVCRDQAAAARFVAHLLLGQGADREQRMGELLLGEAEEEVGLVLGAIRRDGEHQAVEGLYDAGIMAGRDLGGAQPTGMVPERTELDRFVATDAGIGRLPLLVAGDEAVDDVPPELLLHIDHVMLHAR